MVQEIIIKQKVPEDAQGIQVSKEIQMSLYQKEYRDHEYAQLHRKIWLELHPDYYLNWRRLHPDYFKNRYENIKLVIPDYAAKNSRKFREMHPEYYQKYRMRNKKKLNRYWRLYKRRVRARMKKMKKLHNYHRGDQEMPGQTLKSPLVN